MIDEIENKIKEYEEICGCKFTEGMPVVIRIESKIFYVLAKSFNKPFDDILINTMDDVAKYLCDKIQGCILGYEYLGEITLLLIDDKKINTKNKVLKICDKSSDMARTAFNRLFEEHIQKIIEDNHSNLNLLNYCSKLKELVRKVTFNTRYFNIPKEEVIILGEMISKSAKNVTPTFRDEIREHFEKMANMGGEINEQST